MAFRPKYSSATVCLSAFCPISKFSVFLAKCDPVNCDEGWVWDARPVLTFQITELQECLGWDWVVKLPGASPSRGPAESGYQISLKNIPDLHYGLWTRHIKMFMRSLAMSSIQPLGHKLPKALNLIHKDISNYWTIPGILSQLSWPHQYENENKKNKQERQEIYATCLCVCDDNVYWSTKTW